MQDIQNIPNPDVDSPETDEDYGRNPNSDIEQPTDKLPSPPIEEPTDVESPPKIDEDHTDPKMIV
ncbi:MAG: hypothetical protein M3T96_07095 [Acidobacteriota bacterium]|nr:hypothetical protein [Acidobacteriota bacterium]